MTSSMLPGPSSFPAKDGADRPLQVPPFVVELQTRLTALLSDRARCLSAASSHGGSEALATVNDAITTLVREYGAQLRGEPILLEQLKLASAQQQERLIAELRGQGSEGEVVRLKALELRAFELGEAIGLARSRELRRDLIERSRAEFQTLCETHRELFVRFPSLQPLVERIRRDGERAGEQRYLRADATAFELHSAMRWYHADAVALHRLLQQQDPAQRSASIALFRERYEISFSDWSDRAFYSWHARVRSMLHVGAMARIFSERWGVEVGLVDLVKSERESGKAKKHGFLTALRAVVADPRAQRTKALAANDEVQFAGASLFVELGRGRSGFMPLVEALFSLTHEQRRSATGLMTASQCRYLGAGDGTIEGACRERLDPLRAEALIALIHGKDDLAAALLIKLIGRDRRFILPVLQLLDRLPLKVKAEIPPTFQRRLARPLTVSSLIQLGLKAPTADWVMGVVQGDPFLAGAARVRCAIVRITAEWPGEVFYRYHANGDKKVIARYEAHYKSSFWKDIKSRVRSNDEVKILRAFVERGELSPAELVRHCLDGIGADYQGVRECLKNRDEAGQHRLAHEYSRTFSRYSLSLPRLLSGIRLASASLARSTSPLGERYAHARAVFLRTLRVPRDLDQDLSDEFGGHQLFDLRLMRKGRPLTATGAYERLEERLAHERVAFLEGVFKRIDSNGRCWKKDLLLCKTLAERARSGLTNEDENRQLRIAVELVHRGGDAFREAKSRLANVVVNVSSVGGALYATSFVGEAPLLAVMGGASVGAFTLRTLTRRLIQGLGHSRKDVEIDLALSLIEGGTLLWGRALLLLRMGSAYVDFGVRHVIRLLTKSAARYQVTSRMGRLYQAKSSRHVILLAELQAAESRAALGKQLDGSVIAPAPETVLHEMVDLTPLWKRGLEF